MPAEQFAYWTVRLQDISPTAWTVCLQIAHFAYKTAGIKSDVEIINKNGYIELLYVQHYYMSLDTFSMADVADVIETLRTA